MAGVLSLSAVVACEDIKVKFVNVHVLESARYKTKDILSCANRWSVPGSTIFRFVAVTDDNPADIVVKLNQEGDSTVQLGSPTVLSLDMTSVSMTSYNEFNVLHQFGHALGLIHEHQRSCFWRHIRKHLDVDRMKHDLGYHFKNWLEVVEEDYLNDVDLYDPDSVMHFWFMKEWLCNGYSDQHKIFEDYESGELTKEEKNVLMGVHIRSCSLVTSPSLLDIQRAEHIFKMRGVVGKKPGLEVQKVVEQGGEILPSDEEKGNQEIKPHEKPQSEESEQGQTIDEEKVATDKRRQGGFKTTMSQITEYAGNFFQATSKWLKKTSHETATCTLKLSNTITKAEDATGLAIIVGCPGKNPSLPNVLNDCRCAESTFKNRNFAVHVMPMANRSEIIDIIKVITTLPDSTIPEKYKRLVFMFAGHGARKWKINADDDREINVMDEIVEPLVNIGRLYSKTLKKIPKIFLIDACRGPMIDSGDGKVTHMRNQSSRAHRGDENPHMPLRGNYLLAYSTMENMLSSDGNWTRILLDILNRNPEESLCNNLTEVSSQLATKAQGVSDDKCHFQQPIMISTLREKVKI